MASVEVSNVTFDAATYKATTREQWQQAAEAWHRWGPFLEECSATPRP